MKNTIKSLNSDLNYHSEIAKHKRNLPRLSLSDKLIVKSLKREGVYITSLDDLGLISTAKMLDSAKNYVAKMRSPRSVESGYNLPQIYTVTDLQEFFTWGIEKRLQNIIEHYICLPIAFHGVHLRKDFPNEQQSQTLLWHKDSEDRRMIKVIIYLQDVTEKHGAFEYIPLPKNPREFFNYYRVDYALWKSHFLGINDQQMMSIIPQREWRYCTGKAGTVIFVDPRNVLHHGTVRSKERATAFFVYTSNQPKRPELCTQYHDDTFMKPNQEFIPEVVE